jgi:large subunit ribosomal protein L18
MLPKKDQNRLARKRRIRARITGSALRPRLSVFRSLSSMSVQLIDDEAGKTLVAASLKETNAQSNNIDGASQLGKLIAEKAQKAKIENIVFDRSGYKYHGRVKALADAAREAGLVF